MSKQALLTVAFALLLGAVADRAAPADPVRIGFLTPLPESAPDGEGFRQGLRELGYVEGKNIVIEWRRGETGRELRSLGEALVKAKVKAIVTSGAPPTKAAMQGTALIPVVFLAV